MSSLRFGEIRFRVYPQDHEPRHVHGFIGAGEVIVQLSVDQTVRLADRCDKIRGRVKRSEVRKVLDTACEHFEELIAEWERMHG